MELLAVILAPRGKHLSENGANTEKSSLGNIEPCSDEIIKPLDPAMLEAYGLSLRVINYLLS